jgi:hypothetical protein
MDFVYEIFLSHSQGSSTCHKILQHGAFGSTSPLKQDVLRIFIALKNPSPSARVQRANLGSNGKNTNYYITEATLRSDNNGLLNN